MSTILSRSDYILRKIQMNKENLYFSYYCKSKKQHKKKFIPWIDPEDGFLKRLNTETGEVQLYLRNIIESSNMASQKRSKIMLSKLLEMNDFDFFITLTFSPDYCDRTNDKETYALFRAYMDKLRKICPTLRYIAIPEFHKKDNAIHYHIVAGGISWKQLKLTLSGKVCAHWAEETNCICSVQRFELEKHKHVLEPTDGMTIYNVGTYYYGFSTCSIIRDKKRTSAYVKKYIDKSFGTTNKFKRRFYYSSNLKMPEEIFELVYLDKTGQGLKSAYFDNLKQLVLDVDDDFVYSTYTSNNEDYGVLQYVIPKELYNLRNDGWKL